MNTTYLQYPPRPITHRSILIPIRWLRFLKTLARVVPGRRARALVFGLAAVIALGAVVGVAGRLRNAVPTGARDERVSFALMGAAENDWPPMFTPTEYAQFREFHGHFARAAAFFERAGRLTIDGATRGVFVTAVLDDFFGTIGTYAALGRCIKGAETGGESSDIAMLSHALWQSAFHSDPDIVGKQIELDHTVKIVVGVMPEGFQFPNGTDVWLPFVISPPMRYDWTSQYLRIAVRTQPGSTRLEAQEQAREIVRMLDASSRNGPQGRALMLQSIR